MRLDAEYYISKTLIPPLQRIFNLVGANVRNWYEDMPKIYGRNQRELHNIRDLSRRSNTATLYSFMRSRLCTVCKIEETDEGIAVSGNVVDRLDLCYSCREDPTESAYILAGRSQISERRHLQLQAICSDCCSIPFGEEVGCDSRDCPVFYSRLKAASQLENFVTKDSQFLTAIQEASGIL
jgi:DNA polymerase zeta